MAAGAKKVGIFGGSFDPVHEGHIHLARLAKEAAGLDEVRFMPCHISPHKTGLSPTEGALRAGWLRIALEGIEWAKVDETELKRDGPSYSYETVEQLAAAEPGVEWYWIMGGDQWAALPKWRHPERLAALVDFIVLARNGQSVEIRPGYRLLTVDGEHPASATEIRRALAAGETGIPFLHPGIVERFGRL
jgi:nicotinate-nucleotide adenylyltransferase